MTHHPHVHMIVTGGGLSADGTAWIASRPNFVVPVRVLSRLFRRRFLDGLRMLHSQGRLAFFGEHADLANPSRFARWLGPLRTKRWVVYAKPPFAEPESVLAYLARYTHRVAIADSRLTALDGRGATFTYKDFRRDGLARHRHPRGQPRTRPSAPRRPAAGSRRRAGPRYSQHDHRPPCPCCGGRMVIVERFERSHEPRGPPAPDPWSVAA